MLVVESSPNLEIDFAKLTTMSEMHVVPVIVQDIETLAVLMLGYTNAEAFRQTQTTGVVTLWSTSRNELWVKGATSGNYLHIIKMLVNCEQNSLLYLVRVAGIGACHTQENDGKYRKSCYYREVQNGNQLVFL